MEQNEKINPPKQFSERAAIKSMQQYQDLYNAAAKDPDKFWAEEADHLHWFKKWTQVSDWSNAPFAKWFLGAKTNVAYNCLDRHLTTWRKNKAAIIWEGENFEQRILTYQELHRKVCKFANALKQLGLKSGDRSIIYMPMIPEAAIAMLACARLGIIHSVVFGGFSAESIQDRVKDSGAVMVITADGGYRRGSVVPLKANVDAALKDGDHPVKSVIVYRRAGNDIHI